MRFLEYLSFRKEHILQLFVEHAQVVMLSVFIATMIAGSLGILVYRREQASTIALGVTGALLTIPSFALFGLLIPLLGLGYKPTVTALVMYALLPITRNTVAGLRDVDAAVIESAQGMGMSRIQRLRRIELPLAWPVILAGIRVTALLIVAVAAIAGLVNGPGLGNDIFAGLARLGSTTGLYLVLGGTLGCSVLALLLDALFRVVGRLTIPKGIRD